MRHIGKDNPARARSFCKELRDKVKPLARHPDILAGKEDLKPAEALASNRAAIRHQPGKPLGVPVDDLTPNALPDNFRAAVLAQARPG